MQNSLKITKCDVIHSVLNLRVFYPGLPEADAFPGAPRPHPEEDDAQTEAAPGESR